jgi:SAM-dependent methyltransferase
VTASHGERAGSFEHGAADYAASRPDYPDAAVDWAIPAGARDVLDLAAGTGKLTASLVARGLDVVAVEPSDAMRAELTRLLPGVRAMAGTADATGLPDASVDAVTIAQAWHWFDPATASAEIARVLRPGGLVAVTVPRWGPEKVCWALSDAYHEVEGGHIRIYRKLQLRRRLEAAGLQHLGHHYAHALHAPYWWLRCLVGVHDDDHRATKLYHRLLVWDMMAAPRTTRVTERVLNRVIGKSLVCYLRKPDAASSAVLRVTEGSARAAA